ncbi:hypothetical protein B5X24_HaOG209900 [Helicoverpa armigera]|uniref:Uncharacterized protein n=1 Tax=Helicoverpa armigera TaxID=29058 RepID=A0A2W1BKG1_HELAM|nr:hypothetical protein B5X24_HaOG209900 [Helicoverpa armigera]
MKLVNNIYYSEIISGRIWLQEAGSRAAVAPPPALAAAARACHCRADSSDLKSRKSKRHRVGQVPRLMQILQSNHHTKSSLK